MSVQDQVFDAVIVGAGPAGVSCAVWLARLGFAPALIEASDHIGGLCRANPYVDDWNACLPGMTGDQIADNLAQSLRLAGLEPRLSSFVRGVRAQPRGVSVMLQSGDASLSGRFLVLATGVRARPLPGAGDAVPGVLIGPGRHIMAQDFRGLRVAVLGGGDNAFENALYATGHGAAAVRLFARTVRAQRQLVRKVPVAQVVLGDYVVDAGARTVNGEAFDLILVLYGWDPCAEFAQTLDLRRSEHGFIATDQVTTLTSHHLVYAIGEVAQRLHPCVVTAMADGIAAAKAIQARIEADR
ncbi:MAG TPA: NAD(P)/FAD-dependent oxidoreductase [Burkholderiaceae bacterium]|nr:NAD(P)/FAD-dependent oxidoreductase [Burkholderiaceae bacterium]